MYTVDTNVLSIMFIPDLINERSVESLHFWIVMSFLFCLHLWPMVLLCIHCVQNSYWMYQKRFTCVLRLNKWLFCNSGYHVIPCRNPPTMYKEKNLKKWYKGEVYLEYHIKIHQAKQVCLDRILYCQDKTRRSLH